MIIDVIQFGSKTIEYFLEYCNRKTLKITVTPELEVLVKAPFDAEKEKIDFILHKRAPWILKQTNYFLGFFPKQPDKKYLSGETHLYLGRQYRLKIINDDPEKVKLQGRYIYVYTKKPEKVKELLNEWYYEHALVKYQEYLQSLINDFAKYNINPASLEIRKMEKRWGSCTASGKIILNEELIKAPRGCIEYVIIHELCHLIYPSHNKDFIRLQTAIMPTWEKWKERLEKFMA